MAKLAGGALVSVIVQRAFDEWLNDSKATEAARLLFHQVILDEHGQVPAERYLTEEAGLRFAVTPLRLSDEMRGPAYFIEVTNTVLDGNKPERTRHFCHNGATQDFRLTGPRGELNSAAPTVSRLSRVTEPSRASAITEPSDWFVHRTLANPQVYVPLYSLYKAVSDTKQNRRAADRVTSTFRQKCVSPQGQVIADGSPVTGDDLSFWVTPLRSTGGSGRAVFHHVLVVNTAAAKTHPLRVLTLLHSAVVGELTWMA
ncbi:hypothetical protein ACFY2D_11970 [Streptomyces nigra]|uniref:hypothetical protein n=1 Tax=Streptomyces nigra TaxID=1827580 RepID=UPI0036B6C57F